MVYICLLSGAEPPPPYSIQVPKATGQGGNTSYRDTCCRGDACYHGDAFLPR